MAMKSKGERRRKKNGNIQNYSTFSIFNCVVPIYLSSPSQPPSNLLLAVFAMRMNCSSSFAAINANECRRQSSNNENQTEK